MVRKSYLLTALLTLAASPSFGCSNDDDSGSKAGANQGDDDAGPGENKADAGSSNASGTDPLPALPEDVALPIVFVHGFAGSAQQFDSQAQRFAMNGFPAERLYAYEQNGGADANSDDLVSGLDQAVDMMRDKFKVDKVYVIGHSRGTSVSGAYLSDDAHAAKVAKYVSIDGAGCSTIPTPCVSPAQTTNTRAGQTDPIPGQKHVEIATSKESFAIQFKFLFGKDPEVVDIVKQKAPVVISGRAVNFPQNTGREGVDLNVYEVDDDTGMRKQDKALAHFTIGSDGNWGPITVSPDKHYEFVLSSDDGRSHHFYQQHFLRSTAFVRLLSGPADSDSAKNSNVSDHHTNLIASRMREWTPDDELDVGTKSKSGDQGSKNVISDQINSNPIAIFLQDDAATPKESSGELLPWFPMQPFETGVDLYMPGNETPDGTITLTSQPRGDETKTQVIHVPNWASDKHTISLLFSDYPQP